MGVGESTYASRGDVLSMVVLAVHMGVLGSDVRVCTPPRCAELLTYVSVPLVSMVVWP
jgi:vancomycin aglycone glucosyltransferase